MRGSIGEANDYALIAKYRRNDPATVEAAIAAAECAPVDELVVAEMRRVSLCSQQNRALQRSEQGHRGNQHQSSGFHGRNLSVTLRADN